MINKMKIVLFFSLALSSTSLFSGLGGELEKLLKKHDYEKLCHALYTHVDGKNKKAKEDAHKFVLKHAQLGNIPMLYFYLRNLYLAKEALKNSQEKAKALTDKQVDDIYLVSLILLIRVETDLRVCDKKNWITLQTTKSWKGLCAWFSGLVKKSYRCLTELDLFKEKLMFWFGDFYTRPSRKFSDILKKAEKRLADMKSDAGSPVLVKQLYSPPWSLTWHISFRSLTSKQINSYDSDKDDIKKKRNVFLDSVIEQWKNEDWKSLILSQEKDENRSRSISFSDDQGYKSSQ